MTELIEANELLRADGHQRRAWVTEQARAGSYVPAGFLSRLSLLLPELPVTMSVPVTPMQDPNVAVAESFYAGLDRSFTMAHTRVAVTDFFFSLWEATLAVFSSEGHHLLQPFAHRPDVRCLHLRNLLVPHLLVTGHVLSQDSVALVDIMSLDRTVSAGLDSAVVEYAAL